MRFEIRTGGAILILIGLAGLSLVVFALGLFAGYDMARNTAPEPSQAAAVFPLPNPPPEQAKVSAPASEVAPAPVSKAASNTGGAAGNAPSLSMDKNAGPVSSPATRAMANAAAPATKLASPDTASDQKPRATKPVVSNPPPPKYASTGADTSGGHHKPFNIQIDAVMDRTNAEQMTARLQKLGYRAFMVPTNISGQVWWRVRVGPYDSQEEASTAEQELRAKYKESYTP